MSAYYNDIDPAAAAVLRHMSSEGIIARGRVDARSIKDVSPDELKSHTQCHFFAGGGLWSVAARLAGWPDSKPLWTGSCPCQGESAAGKRLGADDPRHLWPDFFRLIRARRPPVVVGEQVAAAAGTHWLDRVCADLEGENYAVRAVDIPACAVDSPQQRQRLYWIAVHEGRRARILSNANRCGRPGWSQGALWRAQRGTSAERLAGIVSFWSGAKWIVSPIDGKARRAKPSFCDVADGIPGGSDRRDTDGAGGFQVSNAFLVEKMMGRLEAWRITGNAIVPILAAEVLAAFLETEESI